MAWAIYDFTNESGDSILVHWLVAKKVSRRDIGQLNQKLDMLRVAGSSLPPKVLAGPIYKNIYKLKVYGDRMLRPFLCKGPLNMEEEYTLLLGAIESNNKLDADPKDAQANRNLLIKAPHRRKDHERY